MNILVLTDAIYPDRTGGIGKSLWTEATALAELGHEVTVLTRRTDSAPADEESLGGIRIVRYRAPLRVSRLYHLYPIYSLAAGMSRVPAMNRHLQLDVAYIQQNPFAALGLRCARLRLPSLYCFQAPIASEIAVDAAGGKYGALARGLGLVLPLVRGAERLALAGSTRMVARSRYMSGELVRVHGPQRTSLEVLPLGVDTRRFGPSLSPEEARAKLGIPADRFVLLTVRRLVARMGLEELVFSVAQLVQRYPKVLLLIAGSGYMMDSLSRLVEERRLQANVRLMGYVPEEDLPTLYRAADLFVLPTRTLEGFGLSTIEALASGTPAVGTRAGATPEVLGPLGDKFLFHDSTPEGMASTLATWIEAGVSPAIRNRCREYCVTHFSSEAIAQSLSQMLEETVRMGLD